MPDQQPSPASGPFRDIVVVGGSAGALQPLRRLIADLPADFPGIVLIVLHIGATSHLVRVLSQRTRLPVLAARGGETIRPGHVYVAVPGVHLLLHDHHLLLRRGPRENLARPAIDPLFRSAACTFGARVVGVVLSGALSDGVAGLAAIKQCGGLAIVQDPDDAAVADMPSNACRRVAVDHVVPGDDLARLLTRLSRQQAGPTPEIPRRIRLETAIAAQEASGMAAEDELGRQSRYTCPECHGALWEIDGDNLLRFRCHVGHAYSADSLLNAQEQGVEEMLWSLLRAHRERAELARRMAAQERLLEHDRLADELGRRADGYEEDADLIGGLLRDRRAPPAEPEMEFISRDG